MSSGPSLYRRHRPRTFAEVVGQEPVVRTLRNAVERQMVHHAYLFVGSRGTGKTSMAKILAACLNCERGPTVEPCGSCESCTSIASATSLDVIEMDAASNNSVDDIRELRESVAYAPVSGREKVYILDEAHMLSPQAWNAFLKTLEEPPPSTIFVLATTEAQKVPATVVDRCHRFDFARPAVEQIVSVVRRVAEAEGIEIPGEAVALIARSATGSFRDGLGMLEQLSTFSGARITLEDVVAVLGVADGELLEEALDAVAAGDARRALLAVARCAQAGRDPAGLIRDLEVHTRELMIVKALDGQVPPELSVTPEADERLAVQAARVGQGDLVRLLGLLAQALEALKAGADGRTQLELALVKAAAPESDSSTAALTARIERLEAALAAPGTIPPAAPAAPASSSPVTPAKPAPPPPAAPSGVAAVALAPEPGPAESPAPLAALPALEIDLATLSPLWPAIVEALRGEKPLLAAVIAEARPVALERGELTLAFRPEADFLRRKAQHQTNRELLAGAVRTVTGAGLRLAFELREDLAETAEPAVSEEEWVARFLTEFDAEELGDEPPADGAPRDGAPAPLRGA